MELATVSPSSSSTMHCRLSDTFRLPMATKSRLPSGSRRDCAAALTCRSSRSRSTPRDVSNSFNMRQAAVFSRRSRASKTISGMIDDLRNCFNIGAASFNTASISFESKSGLSVDIYQRIPLHYQASSQVKAQCHYSLVRRAATRLSRFRRMNIIRIYTTFTPWRRRMCPRACAGAPQV